MLGYTQPNNDLYIFFENDEIERLENRNIRGTHFNLNDLAITGLLVASTDSTIDDRIKTLQYRDHKGCIIRLHLKIRTQEYQRLRERRSFEDHQGFRHICLRDANYLSFSDNINYMQLKYWESQRVSSET